MQYFSDWVKNNIEDFCLFEAATDGESKEKAIGLTNKKIESEPEILDAICALLNVPAIPNEQGITELDEENYRGVFIHPSKGVECNANYVAAIVQAFKNKEIADSTGNGSGGSLLLNLEGYGWVKLRVTGSGAYDAKGHKFIPKDLAPLQECIIAVILEKMIHNQLGDLVHSKNYKLPMAVKRGKTVPLKEDTPQNQFWHWIMDTDPSKKTGIAKYYKIKSATSEEDKADLQAELTNFADAWAPAFYGIASSTIIDELKSVWVKNKANWNKAQFFHYARIDNANEVPNIKSYLKDARCGRAKDTVDKTDIVLGFNAKTVNEHMGRALKLKDIDEHNTLLNHWMNTQELIGISLKKPSKEGPSLAAVNLFTNDVTTNATGENINDDFKVAVYYSDDPAECTFRKKIDPKLNMDDPTKTQFLIFNVNKGHEHDIHGQQVALRIGKAGTNPCNVEFYMTIPKQSAAMGKAGEAFKALDTSPEPEVVYRKNKNGEMVIDKKATPKKVNQFSVTDQYKQNPNDYIALSKWIYKVLSDQGAFANVFGYATGYPVIYVDTDTGEQEIKISAAPYIKIS